MASSGAGWILPLASFYGGFFSANTCTMQKKKKNKQTQLISVLQQLVVFWVFYILKH